MKKIITLLLSLLILASCSKETNKWPADDIIEYSKGNIISVENYENYYEIKIDNTTQEDLNLYKSALKTITYYEYNNNENIFTNDTKYIILDYNDTNEYDLTIKIYNSKPNNI